MMGCLAWVALFVLAIASIIRWFEQITDAVDERLWSRVMLLTAVPLTVWFFPSKVSAGRPVAVPLHEPARGFGAAPAMPGNTAKPPAKKKSRAAVDPEAIARLKRKMRQQGMIEDEES